MQVAVTVACFTITVEEKARMITKSWEKAGEAERYRAEVASDCCGFKSAFYEQGICAEVMSRSVEVIWYNLPSIFSGRTPIRRADVDSSALFRRHVRGRRRGVHLLWNNERLHRCDRG